MKNDTFEDHWKNQPCWKEGSTDKDKALYYYRLGLIYKRGPVAQSPDAMAGYACFSTATGRPELLTRWWLKTRTIKRAIQINKNEGISPCVEFYVPFWAWPLELLYSLIFGSSKLKA